MFLIFLMFLVSLSFAQVDSLTPDLQAKLLRVQEANASDSAVNLSEPVTRSVSSLVLETFIGLALVIGLIFLTVYLMKKLQSSKWGQDNGNPLDLEVIQTKMMGPHQRLVIARVQNEFILLGVTNENITFLKEINSQGIDVELLGQSPAGQEFSQTVNQLLAKFKKGNPS